MTIFLMLGISYGYTQKLHDFNIYFKQNVNEISWDGQHDLDSVKNLLPANFEYYRVELFGYSDGVGSKNHNRKLSLKRAEKVADYFLEMGFFEEKITYTGKGILAGELGEENEKNRKVNIRIFLNLPEFKLLSEKVDSVQHFKLDNRYGRNITTKYGTVLFIPSETFMDADSNTVSGKIDLEYQEYRTPNEFLKRGNPLNDQKLKRYFSSVGMFELKAFKNGKEVYINPKRNISVLFGLNKREKLLDLYHKSDTNIDWGFVRHLTNERGVVTANRNYGPSCGGVTYQGYCGNMGSCESLRHLVNTGLEFSTSELSVIEQFEKRDSIWTLELLPLTNELDRINSILYKKLNGRLKAIESLQSVDSIEYKIERIKRKSNKWIFQIESNLKEFNELEALKNVVFLYKGDMPDSVFKIVWDDCNIYLNKGRKGTIVLKTNGKSFLMKNIRCSEAMFTEEKINSNRQYKEYRKTLKIRLNEVEQRKKICKSFEKAIDSLKRDSEQVYSKIKKVEKEYYSINNLEFHCFWQLSEPYMGVKESKLEYREWIQYFEENKPKMKLRYEMIKNENLEKFNRCDELAIEREVHYQDVLRIMNAVEEKKRDTVIIPFLINQLGVYNAARYAYYTPGNIVHKGYNTEIKISSYLLDSVEVDISCLLIIPTHLNGYYRFDGSYHYSPYHFPKAILSYDSSFVIAYNSIGEPFYTIIYKNELKVGTVLKIKPLKNLEETFDFFYQ